MEIILSLMIVTPLFTALFVAPWMAIGKPTRKRLYKVARAHWTPKFKRKSLAPSIVPEGLVKLEPRNKDWGPDGKLTQMWQDAFDYWQIEDPEFYLQHYLSRKADLNRKVKELEQAAKKGDAVYEEYLRPGSYAVSVGTAVDAKSMARKKRDEIDRLKTNFDRTMSQEERVMDRLVDRYGSEIFYNNDLVRLSSQKQMPTFDYIALTSV